MTIKLLISGESNSGKTTLTKGLENSLVISHDGKRYPFRNAHASIASFSTTEELINFVNEKIEAYNTKYNNYPQTIVFDSVSRVFDTLYDSCNSKYTGFAIYSELDKNIKQLTSYIEDTLIASGFNVVILSHAIFDAETGKYNLVGKGSFAKIGGFLSTVDEAIFIEPKSNKRVLHFRNTKYPARTLQDDISDSMDVSDFNLTDYITHLTEVSAQTDEFSI
jgi:hypothetical protein